MIESFGNENPREYMCNLGKHGGCHKVDTCSKSSHINELKDVLIVQLLIFTYDSNPNSHSFGHKRKIFPNLIVNQEIDQYSLQGIIWHHGSNVDSGHYTSMIKHNDTFYHISDADELNNYPVDKFHCTSDDQSVPYLLFYTKNNTRLLTYDPLNIEMDEPAEPEPIDFTKHEMSNAETKKRTFEPSKDDLDEDNSAKKSKLDAHEEEIIIENEETPLNDLDEKIDEDESVDNLDGQPDKKTFNFNKRKRKCKFTDKRPESAREGMKKTRATDEGKKKQQETNRKSNEKIRKTQDATFYGSLFGLLD